MILSSSNQTVLVSRFFDKEAKNVDRVIKAVEKEIELNYPDIVIDVIKDVLLYGNLMHQRSPDVQTAASLLLLIRFARTADTIRALK